MSRSFAGTDTCLRIVSNIADATTLNTVQVAFIAWVKRSRTSHSEEEVVMISGVQNSTNNHIVLLIGTDNKVYARTRSAANSQAPSAGTITDTTSWHLLVAVFSDISTGNASTSSRTVSLDNSNATNTDNRSIGTASSVFCIGSDTDTTGGLTREFGGLIAYPTLVVGDGLTATDISNLWASGAGADPIAVLSPAHHWDLTGNESPEIDDVGSADLTVVGATFSSDNPFTVGGSDTPIVVEAASAVGEGSPITLIFDQAYVIAVAHAQGVMEGQEIPFILTQPGDEAHGVMQGQDVSLLSELMILVDAASGVGQGGTVGGGQTFTLPVTSGAGVMQGGDVSLVATGLPKRGSGIVHRRRRH